MGGIERPIEILSPADAAACLALSSQAGWNQTEEDWLHFLRRSSVYGIRGPDRDVIATSALLPYGGGGWISLVLVATAWRRRGLARALVERCLAAADVAGAPTYLDATPAGAGLYREFGFRPVCELVRFRREGVFGDGWSATSCDVGDDPRSEQADARGIADLAGRDRTALGLNRAELLEAFARREGTSALSIGSADCLVRRGSRARHIGPLYGRYQDDVHELLALIARGETGRLVIDAYAHQDGTLACLSALGFATERTFQRMTRGAGDRLQFMATAHASAGPEYG